MAVIHHGLLGSIPRWESDEYILDDKQPSIRDYCVVVEPYGSSLMSWLLMWDSSIGWEQLLSDVYLDENGKHYIDWWDGYKHYIGKKLYEDFQIPSEIFLKKISEINIPVKIIWAEFWLSETAKKYYEYANEPKELNIISWADHRFLVWWMDELLYESLLWIDKILN